MSSRYLKDLESRKSKIIHIYRNGDAYSRATFVILRLVEQMELERIIKAIEEKVKLPLNRPIRKLFDMSGVLIQTAAQIEDGKYYVAASAENFFALEYGQPGNWVLVGPVRTNKYANVTFVTKSEEEGKPNKLSTSNNVLSQNKSISTTHNSSKNTKTRKISLSKRKSVGAKQYINKSMAASEHVDKILDNYEVEDTRKSIDQHVEPPEEKPTEHHQDLEGKEDNLAVEIQNTETNDKEPVEVTDFHHNSLKNESHQYEESQSVDLTDSRQPNIDHHQESDHIKVAPEEPQETLQDNIHPDSDIIEHVNQNDLDPNESLIETNPTNLVEDPPATNKPSSEIVTDGNDETDSRVFENCTTENLENNDETPENFKNEAATKIQATFRGYQVRNEMDKAKNQNFQVSVDESAENSEITNPVDDI